MEFIDFHNPVNWLVLGFLLGAAEILLPSTVALGFGAGAVVLAGLLWILPLDATGLPTLTAIWVVASGVCWIAMRWVFKNRNTKDDPYDGDINEY